MDAALERHLHAVVGLLALLAATQVYQVAGSVAGLLSGPPVLLVLLAAGLVVVALLLVAVDRGFRVLGPPE